MIGKTNPKFLAVIILLAVCGIGFALQSKPIDIEIDGVKQKGFAPAGYCLAWNDEFEPTEGDMPSAPVPCSAILWRVN